MRTRLLRAPWWVLALVTGVPFGTYMGVFNVVANDATLVGALVGAAVGGVLFGVLMGVFLARANRRTAAAVGDLPADREAAVLRSAAKGPVPTDPAERAAAARLVAHQLDENRRNAWWTLGVFAMILVLAAWLAVTSSPRWWFVVAVWCVGICWVLWLPSRLRRRLAELQA